MNDRGPLLARFEESASDLRALALVRTVSAVLAILAALVMLMGKLPVPVFLIAVLALLISVVWLRQAQRARKGANQPRRAALLVYATGVQMEDGDHDAWLPWTDVESVEVDEERLDVVFSRRAGKPLRLEPRYAGVDIHQLVRTLDEARRSSPTPTGHDKRG